MVLFWFGENCGSVRYRRRYENIIFLNVFIIVVVGSGIHVIKIFINIKTLTLGLSLLTISLESLGFPVVKVIVELLESLVHDAPGLGGVGLWGGTGGAHQAEDRHRQASHAGD